MPALSHTSPGILVIDDDAFILNLLGTVLDQQGFRVWTSSSGRASIDLYRQYQQEIAVVLLDVCMPGLDGPRTVRELRQLNPALRFCFMSGYSDKYSVEDLLTLGALRYFEKPFQIRPLAEELWQLAGGEVRQSA